MTVNGVNGTNGANGTHKTGIKVIVVGAGTYLIPPAQTHTIHIDKFNAEIPGFGGLAAAIECHRQGHSVTIYEAFPALKQLGDIITFGSNAGRIFARWDDGAITAKFKPLCIDLHSPDRGFRIHKWDTGEVVYTQPSMPYVKEAPFFSGHRGELHEIVFEYAKELGIEINLGRRIEEYWENEDEAGIILDSGEKVSLSVSISCLLLLHVTVNLQADFPISDHW